MPEAGIFTGDPFHRLLARIGLGEPGYRGAVRRIAALLVIAWVPMAVAAALEGHWLVVADGRLVPRESLSLDLATWAQTWGFIPLAMWAEVFIGRRMRDALGYLGIVADPADIARLDAWALRIARTRILHWMCVALAFWFAWAWARTEVANGTDSWHSVVAGPDGAWFSGLIPAAEWLTVAGVWVTFVALPIFTFLWLRWVWKIGVWTAFLARVSGLRLKLMAVHPDRTGGLGCLSNVQTSFSWILGATGILVMAWLAYKLAWEGTPFSHVSIWLPLVVYIFLAPAVFLAPLFLFTSALAETKRQARERLYPLAVDVAEDFRDRWLARPEADAEALLHTRHSSHLADLHAAHRAVEEMRVVPFDRRSALELFSSAALPFAPLLFIAELPEKLDAVLRFFG